MGDTADADACVDQDGGKAAAVAPPPAREMAADKLLGRLREVDSVDLKRLLALLHRIKADPQPSSLDDLARYLVVALPTADPERLRLRDALKQFLTAWQQAEFDSRVRTLDAEPTARADRIYADYYADNVFADSQARDGRADFGATWNEQPQGQGGRRMTQDFGPRGHDYSRSLRDTSVAMAVDEARVNELLAMRLEAKLVRDFELADRLRLQLRDDLGVTVNDGPKEWRADGVESAGWDSNPVSWRDDRAQERQQRRPQVPQYRRVGVMGGQVDEAAAAALVAERAGLKLKRAYSEADEIRARLFAMGVEVADKSAAWFVIGPSGHPFVERGGDTAWDAQLRVDDDVQRLLMERWESKRVQDFAAADAAQNQLRNMGIELDDRIVEWYYSDGRSF